MATGNNHRFQWALGQDLTSSYFSNKVECSLKHLRKKKKLEFITQQRNFCWDCYLWVYQSESLWSPLVEDITLFSEFSLFPLKYQYRIWRSTLKIKSLPKKKLNGSFNRWQENLYLFFLSLMSTQEMRSHSPSQTIKLDFFFAFCQ